MSEHFITEIEILNIRHLHNIKIPLSDITRKHLLLTGKNGAGKTSVLEELRDYLNTLSSSQFQYRLKGWKINLTNAEQSLENTINEEDKVDYRNNIKAYKKGVLDNGKGIEIAIHDDLNIQSLYNNGDFIVAYYPANRMAKLEVPSTVEKVELSKTYDIEQGPADLFIKYLVDLKTQQSFALNENDLDVVENIKAWFERLENMLKIILDDNDLVLEFDYRNYAMTIRQKDRTFGLHELSDGYSSILSIISDLILRMDRKRGLTERKYAFDIEGIVMIDELETHLHVDLQKKILPFLTEFFTKIQFIITTHSPFILNAIDDAIVYDLEKQILIDNMSDFSYEGIIEGYFEVDQYSDEIKKKLIEYQSLIDKTDCSQDDRVRRSELRLELSNISSDVASDLKAEFERIEKKRKR